MRLTFMVKRLRYVLSGHLRLVNRGVWYCVCMLAAVAAVVRNTRCIVSSPFRNSVRLLSNRLRPLGLNCKSGWRCRVAWNLFIAAVFVRWRVGIRR